MTKVILAVLALVFACLFALSTALPSVLSQSVSPQAKPNLPRTLLGKPYRGRWNSPGCWTLVTNRNNANCDADPDHASEHEGRIANGGWTQTNMNTSPRAPILPLVLNTFSESKSARLRLIKSKRPMQYDPCVDNAPLPEKAQSDGINLGGEAEQLQSPNVSRPEEKRGLREVSMPVRRSKRLYDRGEWKSRLFKEY